MGIDNVLDKDKNSFKNPNHTQKIQQPDSLQKRSSVPILRSINPQFHMTIPDQIDTYIASQPEPKRIDLQTLHQLALQVSPGCRVWFIDGKNSEGKTIANPNIGYGRYTPRGVQPQ